MFLAIDLSTPHGHIALVQASRVLFQSRFTSHRSHNSMLYAPLAEALEMAGSELRGIVIGSGPGSYTGVRISIAAAQGIALSRGIPVIGAASVATLSHAPNYRVIGDARRGHFYVGEVNSGRLCGDIAILDEASTREWLGDHAQDEIFTSDDAAPLASAIVQCVQPDAVLLAEFAATLSASELEVAASIELEPIYLQPAFITQAKRPFVQA